MDAGINFAVPQQQPGAGQEMTNGYQNLYDLTSHLSNALLSNNAGSVNALSTAINTSPGVAPIGFNFFQSMSAAQDGDNTLEHPYDILESLKAIPIYNEVLNFSRQESLMNQSRDGSKDAFNNIMFPSNSMKQEIPNNPRKRLANIFQYESDSENKDFGKYSYLVCMLRTYYCRI